MTKQPHTILLLDDDPDFLEVHRHLLETAGYRVVVSASPEQALDMLDAHSPDLIVSDLMMTALTSGFTFAQRVRTSPGFERIPIILVTAVASQRGFDFRPQSDHDLASMSVDAFFEKPVPPKRLLAKIKELLAANSRERNK